MRKILLGFVVAAILGTATAREPLQGAFSLTLADGAVVGVGELEEGKLKLKLLEGSGSFDGTLVFETESGPVAYEVTVGADGSLYVWDLLLDVTNSVRASGGEVEVEYEDAVEAEVSSEEEAAAEAEQEAAEAAEEEAERAAEDAEEAAEEAAEAAEEAEEAAERAAEEAERAAEEAEEAAERAAEEAEEQEEANEVEDEEEEEEEVAVEDEEEEEDDRDD